MKVFMLARTFSIPSEWDEGVIYSAIFIILSIIGVSFYIWCICGFLSNKYGNESETFRTRFITWDEESSDNPSPKVFGSNLPFRISLCTTVLGLLLAILWHYRDI